MSKFSLLLCLSPLKGAHLLPDAKVLIVGVAPGLHRVGEVTLSSMCFC